MSLFGLDQQTAKVKRLSYTTDASLNKKSAYAYTGVQAKGYLSPIGTNNASVGIDRFGQVRNFETNYPFSVEESDILEIESVDYKVQSFARARGMNIDRVRCVLVLSKTE